jgi:tRNA modification GTPase
MPRHTTSAIELTPPGRAAVAVVLVAGPQAAELILDSLHRPDSERLRTLPVERILVGRWGSPSGEEVVVCRRSDESVEVHCHGGTAAVRTVMERLTELGCRPMSWQDWIRRCAVDPLRTEAEIALAAAPTSRTAAILLDQYHGALSRAVQEACDAAVSNDWPRATATLEAILSHRGVGQHLTRPWRIVLAGRPNVGKSSLLNALSGFQRAIVADLPGTTRDVVTAETAIDGWPVQLADTAGLRNASNEIETAGVARASAAALAADLVLLVDDASIAAPFELPHQGSVLRVLTKIDLPHSSRGDCRSRFDVCVSAHTGEGIPALLAAIGKTLVPAPPKVGDAVAFTDQQFDQLDRARAAAGQRDSQAVLRCLQPLRP